MSKLQTIIVLLVVAVLSACSGGGGGSSKSVTGTAASYSNNGASKTVTTSYSDGTTTTTTLTGTLTTPSYSADGSQKTLVYSFSDGTTHNGATLTGALTTANYSADGSQKTLVYSFSDGTTHNGLTLTGVPNAAYANDHVTATITYSFSDNTQNTVTKIVEPTLTAQPTLTPAVYPADWSTGTSTGTVQKPSVSAASGTYGDTTSYNANGSTLSPYRQATLTPNGPTGLGAINDPNAVVKTPTKGNYDLTWGTPDVSGPKYANNFAQGSASYTLPKSTFIFRAVLSSSSGTCAVAAADTVGCGATLTQPSGEVIDAWNKGWTGNGQNVLIWDNIGASPLSSHAAIVETIAHRYAWGANFYGMSWSNADPSIPLNKVLNLDGTQTSTASALSMNVINMSFGADLAGYLGNQPANGWSVAQLIDARSHFSGFSADATLLTQTASQGAFNFNNAIIVKAAGNDTIDAQYEAANWYLAQNGNTVIRLLIVGALNGIGTTSNRADITNYSNRAGSDPTIQSRFLMESGNVAYAGGANAYGGSVLSGSSADGNSGSVGTSFAAPRVAAYAAIVRQKFPNVTAANTADILLATARYDTLTCYPNCDKAIYGQGEASLSRALAPVGYLR